MRSNNKSVELGAVMVQVYSENSIWILQSEFISVHEEDTLETEYLTLVLPISFIFLVTSHSIN